MLLGMIVMSAHLFTGCQILLILQPATAQKGEIITIYGQAQATNGGVWERGYLAVHLPLGWQVLSAVYQGDHSGVLTLDPASQADLENNYGEEGYYWWSGISEQEFVSKDEVASAVLTCLLYTSDAADE